MSTNPDTQSTQDEAPAPGRTGIGRRHLLRAGLSAAPVMLAVSGRSAMAAPICSDLAVGGLSPMAWASLSPDGRMCAAMSHAVGRNSLGRSPGYWRPNKNGQTFQAIAWPAPTVVPFSNYTSQPNLSWSGIAWNDPRWATGTKFNEIFTGSNEGRSFSRILIDESGNSAGNMNWFLCAAYLNALTVTNYALTAEEVIKIQTGELQINNLIGFLKQTWN
ncbi:MAG: hypothetical protein U1F00_03015 [Rhodoferax sp.]